MATQQIDEYYESLAYWKQQAQDYEQALRDIEYNTIMNMTAEIEQLKAENICKDLKITIQHDKITALKSKLKIASAALEVVKVHNGINTHYPIVYATVTQALRDVGEI